MKNKYEAFILGSYLDTIGFLNGYMEFNEILQPLFRKNDISGEYTHYINIMNFFKMGGFNINLKLYNASDDTILNIANAKVLIKNKFNINDFIDSYLEYFDKLINEVRATGEQTTKALKNLKKVRSPNVIEYDENVLGNGAVMRACVFGLKYHYKKDINLLYKWVIDTSKLTHNNIEAYIPSLICALISSMSIEKIVPFFWINELNELKNIIKFNSKEELNFYNKIVENLEKILNDLVIFNSSYEYNFSIYNNKPLIFYSKLFQIIDISRYDNEKGNLYNIGGIAEDLIYLSFYNIINCFTLSKEANKKLKEKTITVEDLTPNFMFLVLNSSLSYGDSDTIGMVCGFWYGGLFGFRDVPKINFKNLEFYQDIKNITDSL